jgi:hypothetical protein
MLYGLGVDFFPFRKVPFQQVLISAIYTRRYLWAVFM